MSDGVVQFACQSLTFEERDALDLAYPCGGPVPEGPAHGDGRQQDGERTDRVAGPGLLGDRREAGPGRQQDRPDHGLASGNPPEQRMRQEQQIRRRVQQGVAAGNQWARPTRRATLTMSSGLVRRQSRVGTDPTATATDMAWPSAGRARSGVAADDTGDCAASADRRAGQ
jgi:hypothetical protein